MSDKEQYQERLLCYSSAEEYFKELTGWGKAWVSRYSQAAVDTSEEGEISLIKGKLLFKRELAGLCREPFVGEEISQYEAGTERLMEWQELLHEKSRQYISRGGMITMEYIYQMFGFDAFEWYLFTLAFMAEADTQFERIFVVLQDDFEKKRPTLDLCIRMFTLDEERQYELKQRVTARWDFLCQFLEGGLEELWGSERREGILGIPLYLDRRIVRFIYDMDSEDPVLRGSVSCYLPSAPLKDMLVRREQVEVIKRMYEAAGDHGFLYLSGDQDGGKKFLVRHLCRSLQRPLLMVNMKRLTQLRYSTDALVRRLARESVLKGSAVVCLADLELPEEDFSGLEDMLHSLADTCLTPIFTAGKKWQESVKTGELRCMELELPALSPEERRVLWQELLSESSLEGEVDAERLAATYQLPAGAIERVVRETESRLLTEQGTESLEKLLYSGCQRQLVHSLGQDAVRIPAQYTMEELILADAQKQLLTDACNMVKYHHQVFGAWGFRQKMAYGRGVSMIFYGPPGTGKTMGAQAIANELNLELYRVDMASVLSKYVGESEKKLGNIFEQGQRSQSILFFDEADALFGKRSEVKDSQDKYANASTAFLLQKLEEYQGIIILATNLLQNFDQAFCRRFQFIVEFPLPDEQKREEIWRQVFPEALPREELDYTYLAREFTLSGSQIKNIAAGAAFLAAGEGGPVEMIHILRVLKREKKKTGKNMLASDFGVYGYLMESERGEG
ncbi:MAG: ATP-binding protein [Lachnospiraceae bacterium]|nr:ATP-binding protein [Lachnospiraceae bacterium]